LQTLPHRGTISDMNILMFTPTQAATVTGLPLKKVQKAIDSDAIPVFLRRERGRRINKNRYLPDAALLCLMLEAEGVRQLPLRLRKLVFKSVCLFRRRPQIRINDVVWVDVGRVRAKLARNLRDLRNAKRMVTSDPDFMGGTPLFKGTRIPIQTVAKMLNSGAAVSDVTAAYPQLTEEQVRLAGVHAKASPRRGRPRAK
jgi:uncharacterized protein (DUF433 family)